MSRNKIMGLTFGLSIGLLVAAVFGAFRVFSYLAGALFLATIATAVIERADSELDLSPYTGLIAFFGALFAIGLSGIWLLWSPGTSTYEYVLGLPRALFVYVVFLWFLPAFGSIYYSVAVFPEIGDEETVESILDESLQRQRGRDVPLGIDRTAGDDTATARGED